MPRKKTWNFLEMGYDEAAVHLRKNDTLLVSMGSGEKLGAHRPLGADLLTTMGVVERAA